MYGGLGVKAQYMYALLLSVRVLVHEHGVDPIYGVTWTLIMIQGPYKTDMDHLNKSTKGEAGGGLPQPHGSIPSMTLAGRAFGCTAFTPTYQLTTLAGRLAGGWAYSIRARRRQAIRRHGDAIKSNHDRSSTAHRCSAGKGRPIRHGGGTERRRRRS